MFGNFSLFKTPFPGQDSLPGTELPLYLLCLFFHLLYFSYLFLKTMICFSRCLMSSAGIQKLFCGICSALKCSFDEFVGETVVSPSYSFAILGPPLAVVLNNNNPPEPLPFSFSGITGLRRSVQPCVALSSDPSPSGVVLFLALVFRAEAAAGLISEGSLCEPRCCGAPTL